MSRCLVLLMFLCVALAWPAAATAADAKKVDVEVWTIRATTRNTDISPELRSLAQALKTQFKYTGFKLEKKAREQVAIGKAYKTTLLDDYKVTVTPKERLEKKVKLQVTFSKKDKSVLNTTYTIGEGQFQLFGGWKIDNGDALIVAVRAR